MALNMLLIMKPLLYDSYIMTTMICKSKYSESLFNALYIEIKNRYIYIKKKHQTKQTLQKMHSIKVCGGNFHLQFHFAFAKVCFCSTKNMDSLSLNFINPFKIKIICVLNHNKNV